MNRRITFQTTLQFERANCREKEGKIQTFGKIDERKIVFERMIKQQQQQQQQQQSKTTQHSNSTLLPFNKDKQFLVIWKEETII